MNSDNFLEGFFDFLRNRTGDTHKRDITPMTRSENEAWRELEVEKNILFKKRDRFSAECKAYNAKVELFWYRLRESHKLFDVDHLSLDTDREMIMENYSAPEENES
jgi:hypothetical protein